MDVVIEAGGETRRHLKSFAQLQELCKANSTGAEGVRGPPPTSAAFWGPGDPLCNREPVLGCSTSGASSFTWERALFEEMKAS